MNEKIVVIGLGYVGLPLAVEFSKSNMTIGFDINKKRILELNKWKDSTREVSEKDLKTTLIKDFSKLTENKRGLFCTSKEDFLAFADYYIITVPTPIDEYNQPDLTPIINASKLVGKFISPGKFVIYESTVYPGLTEEICIPILEKQSNLKVNHDFFVGYSPERINPGDKTHTLRKIKKITSGSSPFAAKKIDHLYQTIIDAGTYLAPSIKVAEAAKIIENSQRDINIAFMNELSKIFNLLKIDTISVLEAAETKWNFLPFRPGLVGGHCIGVDPYYLATRSKMLGYNPEIILTGRRMNDGMGQFVGQEVIKLMIEKDISLKNSSVLLLGITFKENCPDTRNTKVIDIYNELKAFKINDIDIYDPWANLTEVQKELNITLLSDMPSKKYDCIILAVAHREFLEIQIENFLKIKSVVYDVKGLLNIKQIDKRL